MQDDVLVKVENVSKKFCTDLKTSLWYGLKDMIGGVNGNQSEKELRPKEFWAVRDINFELRRGECLGLIGHNGAGKSTLLKMLNGLINPDAGTITMHGRVGALIELGAGFNPILTGRENIYNNGAVLGFSRKEIDEKIEAIIDFSEIRQFIDMPVQNYSSGMKVRLGFAVAAQMDPDVLIIDEVLAVGDVGFRFKCLNVIGEIMKNAAVIFVSRSMPMIYRVCNHVILMDHGMIKYNSRKVGDGIDQYFKLFKDVGKRKSGSLEADLLDFTVKINEEEINEEEEAIVSHGAQVQFELKLKIDSKIEEAILQLVIWNQEMLPIIDIMDKHLDGFLLKNDSNEVHEVRVNLPSLQLNSGKHYMSLHINTPDLSRNLLRLDNLWTFNIKTVSASGAHLLLPVDWTLK
jgi:lipopolysaccharide transport system ATP-binding protein